MLVPTDLEPLAAGLREDAAELRARRAALVTTTGSLVYDGPRGDAFRTRVQVRAAQYEGLARELEAAAGQVVQLQREVERELRYLAAIRERFTGYACDARQALTRARSQAEQAAQQAQAAVTAGLEAAAAAAAGVVQGDLARVRGAAESALHGVQRAVHALQELSALERRHAHLPVGDPGWRAADTEARRSDVAGWAGAVAYRTPVR